VGIEAVSRGASPLVMVDSEPLVVQQLLDTCRALDLRNVRVQSARLPEDLSRGLPNLDCEFDLIFADPPYAFEAYAELLEAAVDRLSPTGEIAVEHESRRQLSGPYRGILGVDQRRYGDSCLSFFQRDPEIQG
jgi:16S rRNA (guanine966-N2)-methyltransferase